MLVTIVMSVVLLLQKAAGASPGLAAQGGGQDGVDGGKVSVGGLLCLGFSAPKGLESKHLLGPLLALQLGEGGHDDDEGGQVAIGVLLLGLCSSERIEQHPWLSPGLAFREEEKVALDVGAEVDGVHKHVSAVEVLSL